MLCGSAYRDRGIEPLLDAVVAYLPSPRDVPPVRGTGDGAVRGTPADPAAPFAGLVFKVNSDRHRTPHLCPGLLGHAGEGDTVLDAGSRRTERVARDPAGPGRPAHRGGPSRRAATSSRWWAPKHAPHRRHALHPGAALVLEPPRSTRNRSSRCAVEAHRPRRRGPVVVRSGPAGRGGPVLVVRTDPEPVRPCCPASGNCTSKWRWRRSTTGARAGPSAVGRPQVTYRETVVWGVSGLVYRHVKQEGGSGQ